MKEGRGFRPQQKGVECSVDGCDNWCVSNDLCPKHNMAQYRLTQRGKAYIKEYNKRYKRPDIKKTCIHCGCGFITAREAQALCSRCSVEHGAFFAQKKYRSKPENKIKVRARDIVNKRIQRGAMDKDLCVKCGEDAEMHHENYDNPLEVEWLCKKHHVEVVI